MDILDFTARKIRLRSFYGFSPEDDGYIGWSEEKSRDRMIEKTESGDLFLIYGAASQHTAKAQRNKVLGFLQIDPEPIMDHEKSSEEGMHRKIENGWANKWHFAIPVRRAWRATETVLLTTVAPETYRPEAGQSIAVWNPELSPTEMELAAKVKVREVPVFGENYKGPFAEVETNLAKALEPSKPFPSSAGIRIANYEDGKTFMYLARFNGDGHALIDRQKEFGDHCVVMKIGVTNSIERRETELNSGLPPAATGKWKIELRSQPYDNHSLAEAAESEFKSQSAKKLESLGREFFWGDWLTATLVFAGVPGTSRF